MMGHSLQLFQLSLSILVTGNLENGSWLTGQNYTSSALCSLYAL